jgi:hypothetical protein
MRDIDLFQLALGLVPPWMVAVANFDAEKKRLDIEINFKTGGCFPCPTAAKQRRAGRSWLFASPFCTVAIRTTIFAVDHHDPSPIGDRLLLLHERMRHCPPAVAL